MGSHPAGRGGGGQVEFLPRGVAATQLREKGPSGLRDTNRGGRGGERRAQGRRGGVRGQVRAAGAPEKFHGAVFGGRPTGTKGKVGKVFETNAAGFAGGRGGHFGWCVETGVAH